MRFIARKLYLLHHLFKFYLSKILELHIVSQTKYENSLSAPFDHGHINVLDSVCYEAW